MKCPVCKYLNVREEARKHLNNQTVQILGQAHLQLAVPMTMLVAKTANCNVHNDSQILADHLINASDFSHAYCRLVELFPLGVPATAFQPLLNKYPDPRKKLDKQSSVG